jgi:hypothetical protein
VSELTLDSGDVCFSLPAAVMAQQHSATALDRKLQSDVATVQVDADQQNLRDGTSICVAVQVCVC